MPDDNPRIFLGANNPPVADPFEGFAAHINDLFEEAKNHLDGEGVESQSQADAVSQLLDMLRKAAKDADAARTVEKKPHDDAAKAVQAKWKPLLDRAELAVTTCKQALAPWLMKVEAEKRAAAEAARLEAEGKARVAAEAMRAAQSTDLAALEAAEALVEEAKRAGADANRAEQSKAHAKGGERATGLRSYFTPILTDPKAALVHYVATNPEAVKGFLLALAKADVAAGKRAIPGFEITEERRVV
jgi:Xaa-Pro aminopeptidase